MSEHEKPWRVWRDGEWTILHVTAGGAETTSSLTEAQAWELIAALTPLTKRAPNPEWEARAQASHRRIMDELAADGEPPTSLEAALRMLDTWTADAEPANELGQISFSRGLMESAAEAIRSHLAQVAPETAETGQ